MSEIISNKDLKLSDEDIQILRQAHSKVNESITVLGRNVRTLSMITREAKAIIAKQQQEVDSSDKSVTEAEEMFKSILAIVVSKYGVSTDEKSNLDLSSGVLSFG